MKEQFKNYQSQKRIGLYLHIPFCIKKCPYCDFYSLSLKPTKYIENKYLEAVKKEIILISEFIKRELNINKISFITFYAGGGTPSILSPYFYESLFNFLAKHFDLSPIEVTLEANPDTLNLSNTRNFFKIGFNRISLGVQSFFEKGLKFLGRTHNVKNILKAIDYIVKSGFENFSFDLIFGWKGQGERTLKKEILKALNFSPPHLSFYELTIEKNTLFYKLFKNKYWISEKKLINFYKLIEETLESYGYTRYEISNYAIPGHECKHNLLYWKMKPYLGLGPSAVSRISNLRWENPRNLKIYLHSLLKENKLPFKITEKLNNIEFAKEYIFMGLRLKEGIKLSKLKEYNVSLNGETLKILISKNLIVQNKDKIYLTFYGKLLHNQIAKILWENLI